MAKFLLELAMLEPMIQHGFPHAYLAVRLLCACLVSLRLERWQRL